MVVARSRREIFETHVDRTRMARCPVCRWAVEQDHQDALAMQAGRTAPSPLPGPAPAQVDEEDAVVVGFALV